MTSMEDKKLFIALELVLILITVFLMLAGCGHIGSTYQSTTGQPKSEYENTVCGGYFVVLESWGGANNDGYYIIYAPDTNVKYFIKWAGYQFGITPLYNADGTLQVYEEADDQSQQ